MSGILTSRQAAELHKSIIAYLAANNLPSVAATLRTELSLGEDVFDAERTAKYQTLLEKKWTGAARLQKKACSWISLFALQFEVDNTTSTSHSKRNQDPTDWLPRSPPRHSLESHQAIVNCLAFHPTFSVLASGSDDYTIKIWDWELGELERTLKGHIKPVLDVDYGGGGPKAGSIILLASCSSDSTIKLWDPADEYKNIRTLTGHEHSVSAVRFVPGRAGSETLLVSASGDKTLRLWDVTTGYCVRTLQGHTGWVRDVCPSLDGRYLLSAGSDQMVRLWDVSAADPESKLVMVGHENGIRCCAFAPAASYPYLAALAGLKKPPPTSSTAEFMATGSRDKTIKLWDAQSTCFKTLVGHDNWVSALAFHPGGKYLLSVADDKTLRCWDLSQDGQCVKVLADAHGQFITCLRWAPEIVKKAAEQGGERTRAMEKTAASEVQIRCLVATGSVDKVVRIFAD
ncbi:LIS-1 2 [Parachaetomium inaequale]|uniref:Nuclear distribution protein PAC1 n=1 Tax=Parachaetomium inaequale TaxID=2588326 RepID=A0AAN6P8B2_9PEZI|nr:LIS-1 2 [Parachaetomium inaequale]